MKKESKIVSKKRLLITNERLDELAALISKYCTQIAWKATLRDGAVVTFDSLTELQQYSNFGSAKIIGIKVNGYSDDFSTRINATISMEYPTLKRFGECVFEFKSVDKHTVFKNEIQAFFDKCVEGELAYQVGKWLSALVLLGTVLFIVFTKIKVAAESFFLIITFYFMLIGFAFLVSIAISTKVWDRIYPAVVFSIGEEATRYEKSKKWRTGIFWSVIVAGALGLILNLLH